MKFKSFLLIFLFCALNMGQNVFAQQVLKSPQEEYYDFISLTGGVSRDFLIYRTLEESTWSKNPNSSRLESDDVWKDLNLGKHKTLYSSTNENSNFFTNGFDKSIKFMPYGAECFSSWNSKAPFGQNDGALWQGRGLNVVFSAGARLEGYGFSASFRPQLSFSQNKEFEIMSSFINEYGYFWGQCDAPQRFGDSSFWTYDWGDTEIRWSWKKFTIGFGTEAIWLGPSSINSTLLSNNAPTFPKFDFGLRRTEIFIPFFDIYIGDIESRFLVGKLTESDYFDKDSSNDHNQFALFSFAYAPSFMKGFTLGVSKVTVSKWGDASLLYAYPGFYGNTLNNSKSGRVGEDQKAMISADWIFTDVGFEVYGELGFDDFLADGMSFYEYARYPFHTITYTVGAKKTFEVSKKHNLRGLLQFEWNNTEGSQDYQMWSGSRYGFGFHHQIIQGYTNRGQWLGSGIGYGGNSQVLSFTLYSPHGYEKLFIARNNIDNNYVYYKSVDADKSQTEYNGARYYTAFKANFYVGFENLYYLTRDFSIKYGALYDLIINPTYSPGYNSDRGAFRDYSYWHNFNIQLVLKYQL